MKALASLDAEDMITYSDPKGELQLRKKLEEYLRKSEGLPAVQSRLFYYLGFRVCIIIIKSAVSEYLQ